MSARELITEHLDLWAGAVAQKATRGRGSNGKVELTGVKKLRELILELAVRGKLVEQNPEDQPAQLLLEHINKEVERLVTAGQRKKRKPTTLISDDEVPFQIPKNWIWARLGALCELENGDRSKNYPNKSALVAAGIPFVNAGHIRNYEVNQEEMTFISEDRFNLLRSGKFREGDILFCLRGSLGKAGVVKGLTQGAIASSLIIARPILQHSEYLLLYLKAPLSAEMVKQYDNGTAQPNLSGKDFGSFLVPLPPEAEQHRIVQKVDELMALCDRLEKQTSDQLEAHETLVDTLLGTLTQSENATELADNWARLAAHFDTLFTTEQSIDKLEQTILQLGMMGLLTEPSHGLMSPPVTLETLKAEKEAISHIERIKAPKVSSDSLGNEGPYKLPASWLWARVGDVIALKHGYAFKSSYFTESEGLFVLTTPGNFHESGGFRDRGPKTRYYEGPIDDEFVLKAYDLIIPMTEQAPGLLGSAAFIPENEKSYLHNQRLGKLVFSKTHFDPRFIYWFFNSKLLRNELAATCSGTTVRHTSPSKVAAAFIPVPDVRIQNEIALKIDELMALCDQLKERLNKASETRCQLAESVIEISLT